MTEVLHADAYGSKLALEGSTLLVTAKGRMGRGALGTDERLVELSEVTAVDFHPAGRMKNGRLEIVDPRGKTIVHFRHKQNAEVLALLDAAMERIPVAIEEGSTKGVAGINEDRDRWAASKAPSTSAPLE